MRGCTVTRWASRLAVALFLAAAASATAGEAPIFTITDPRGDDRGDGSLIYPVRDDLTAGELDLVQFSARPDAGGTVFEVTFARAVRKPYRRTMDRIGTSLDSVARYGFYNFNVDVYIDTDRVPDSGKLELLPGRRAEARSDSAWEKAVCLTPRPNEARAALRRMLERAGKVALKQEKGRVEDADERELEARVAKDVEAHYYFPTLVWASGRSVRFFVPSSYLGGTAQPSWGYIVAVSAADLTQAFDLDAAISDNVSEPRLAILPVEAGRGPDKVGGGRPDDEAQPPLLDIIVPPDASQAAVLKDYDPRFVLTKNRPVRLPAVVPASVTQ